jgi:hypothetical protein
MIIFTVNSTTDLLSLTLLPSCTSTPATGCPPCILPTVPTYLSSLAFGYRQIDYNSIQSPYEVVVPSHIGTFYQPSTNEEPINQIYLTKSSTLTHLQHGRQLPESRRPWDRCITYWQDTRCFHHQLHPRLRRRRCLCHFRPRRPDSRAADGTRSTKQLERQMDQHLVSTTPEATSRISCKDLRFLTTPSWADVF